MAPLRRDFRRGRWYFVKERRGRWRKKRIGTKGFRVLMIILALLILLIINLNNIASFITERIIIYQIEKRVTFQVSCKSLKANIFTDRVIIEEVRIISSHQFGKEPFIYIPRIEGFFRYKSLFKKKIIMDGFIYYQPQVFLERNPEGKWNFPDKKRYRKARWFFTQSHWRAKKGRVVIKDGWVSEEPFFTTFEDIEVKATNFSNQIPTHARYFFNAQLVSPGPLLPIKGKGRARSLKEPIAHTAYLEVKDLDLFYFNSYQKKITPFNLTKGRMDLETELKYLGKRLEGKNSLKIKEIVLEGPKGAVISCPKMEARLLSQFLPKKRIILDDVILSHPIVFLSRNREGQWNLPSGEETKKETRWPLFINSLEVKRGKIVFKDDKISHKTLITKLENIALRVEHLSTSLPAGAHYELRALLNQAPLEAKGGIGSFRSPFDFNLNLKVKDLDLVPFDLYQRKITSCQLVKGRMDLETDLKCEKNKLDSLNRVTFENLRLQPILGAPPSLIKVMGMGPATLATVLRDEKGRIKLDIPVGGDITDPEFKVGSALLKASIRAIQETIIAPFDSVAKLITTKEGVSKIYLLPIEFVKGTTNLTKGALGKLVDLTRFLVKYPVTALHIRGYTNSKNEKEIERREELGYERAKKVKDYLVEKAGILEEKIKLSTKEKEEKKEAEIRIEE